MDMLFPELARFPNIGPEANTPLEGFSNVIVDLDTLTAGYTFSSGTSIQDVTGQQGPLLDPTTSGTEPNFATPGIEFDTNTDNLFYDGFGATAAQTFIMLLSIPAAFTNEAALVSFASAEVGQARARFVIDDNGTFARIRYYKDDGDVILNLDTTLTASSESLCMFEFVDDETLNYYRDDLSTPMSIVDPRANYSALTEIILGARNGSSDAPLDHSFRYYGHIGKALSSGERSTIQNRVNAQYGLSL